MACQRFPWSDLSSVTGGEKSVILRSTNERETVLATPDARSLLEEVNRQAGMLVSTPGKGFLKASLLCQG